jgi:hypothetical protein
LKNLSKVTGPNQISLAVGHQATAKVDDWCDELQQDLGNRWYDEIKKI